MTPPAFELCLYQLPDVRPLAVPDILHRRLEIPAVTRCPGSVVSLREPAERRLQGESGEQTRFTDGVERVVTVIFRVSRLLIQPAGQFLPLANQAFMRDVRFPILREAAVRRRDEVRRV